MTNDFIIIGGGPAGSAAALFAAKLKRNVAVIHKGTNPLLNSFNWFLPGFEKDFGPAQWMETLHRQMDGKIQVVNEEVVEATLGASEKKITTQSKKILDASVIILASGCYNRKGLIEGEEKFVGHGVYYNAYQDGHWFDGSEIIVEGKNENAIREVIYLSRFASKINFIVPAMRLEGDERLLRKIQDDKKIDIYLSSSIKKIEGARNIESVVVLSAGEEKAIKGEGVFLYSRHSVPQYDFLKGTVEISPEGSVLVDEQFMTSIPGVFACGDMLSGVPQLPFVSAAQGLVTAMFADRHLSNL